MAPSQKRKEDGASPAKVAKREKIAMAVARYRERAAGKPDAPKKLKPGPKPSQP